MHKDSEPAVRKLRVTEKTRESNGFPLNPQVNDTFRVKDH
jgi:hypothetical protein